MDGDTMTDAVTRWPTGGFRRRGASDLSVDTCKGGTSSGLSFVLHAQPGSGKTHTMGTLHLYFAEDHVWSTGDRPQPNGVWGAFLKGLADAWLPLCAEQGYPHGTIPRTPSRAFDALLREFVNPTDAQEIFAGFRRRHDIAAWFGEGGLRLPSLYALREGQNVLLETGGQTFRWPAADVLRTFERLGDAVEVRLGAAHECVAAREAWRDREERADADIEAMVLGVDATRARALADAGAFARTSRRELLRGFDEVRAAARMLAVRVADEQIASISALIRAQDRIETPVLDRLSSEAMVVLNAAAGELPRVQGQHLAAWLRAKLGLEECGTRVDPEAVLQDWDVPVVIFETEPSIEAVCFWGERHGPSILFNSGGRSNRRPASSHWQGYSGGGRATLAHEICHLLVDRKGALPAAEVLGGSVPYAPEERASSFAAELLLPREFAGATYQRSATVRDAVEALSDAYMVSWTVAAWQILNRFGSNEAVLSVADRRSLHEIADPNRFSESRETPQATP